MLTDLKVDSQGSFELRLDVCISRAGSRCMFLLWLLVRYSITYDVTEYNLMTK